MNGRGPSMQRQRAIGCAAEGVASKTLRLACMTEAAACNDSPYHARLCDTHARQRR